MTDEDKKQMIEESNEKQARFREQSIQAQQTRAKALATEEIGGIVTPANSIETKTIKVDIEGVETEIEVHDAVFGEEHKRFVGKGGLNEAKMWIYNNRSEHIKVHAGDHTRKKARARIFAEIKRITDIKEKFKGYLPEVMLMDLDPALRGLSVVYCNIDADGKLKEVPEFSYMKNDGVQALEVVIEIFATQKRDAVKAREVKKAEEHKQVEADHLARVKATRLKDQKAKLQKK
jgi:hypothetical protein